MGQVTDSTPYVPSISDFSLQFLYSTCKLCLFFSSKNVMYIAQCIRAITSYRLGGRNSKNPQTPHTTNEVLWLALLALRQPRGRQCLALHPLGPMDIEGAQAVWR